MHEKFHAIARFQPQMLPDWFGDGCLSLSRDRRFHEIVLPFLQSNTFFANRAKRFQPDQARAQHCDAPREKRLSARIVRGSASDASDYDTAHAAAAQDE
ncbi:MAG: hypothetical protein GIX03_02115 [Candidatus Eremiobacteraeota bacterium]|nr:hypothetical protein [Candidatus Eremiobacteraeota bacterium]